MKKKKTESVVYIDPPQGWVYGFPKAMPVDVKDVEGWLVQNGYPKEIIESFGKNFIYRIQYSIEIQ